MKVLLKVEAKNFIEKYKHLLPEGADVKEVYELEIPWYRKEWYIFKWWQFVIWLCEIIVPELKDDPNKILFGYGKPRRKINETK